MRRRVDLRWRVSEAEIERLARTQLQLLGEAAPLVEEAGLIVYSTCSLELEENRQVIDSFLSKHPRFQLNHERELLPFDEGTDGAYVAKLRRVP